MEIAANETDLTCIEPLEIPPMGDCDLKEIKERHGGKISLKGNLHTTEIMLYGTPKQVEDACKKRLMMRLNEEVTYCQQVTKHLGYT